MEPAEKQETIPTESQKEKERGREIAKGMKAYCGLSWNYSGGGGGVKRRRDRREETAANEKEKKKELQ